MNQESLKSDDGHKSLINAIIVFGTYLRGKGIPVSPEHFNQAMRALTCIDLTDPQEFYIALRAILLDDPDQFRTFDEAFGSFWKWPSGGKEEIDILRPAGAVNRFITNRNNDRERRQKGSKGVEQLTKLSEPTMQDDVKGATVRSNSVLGHASELPPLQGKSLYSGKMVKTSSRLTGRPDLEKQAVIQRMVDKIVKQLALNAARRYKAANHGQRYDLRKTIRINLRYGGKIINLIKKKRKLRKPRIILICDVSRSMEPFSVFVLQMVYSFQSEPGRIESFIFSTMIKRTTPYFKCWNLHLALEKIAADFPYWSGGTRIGESLAQFNRDHSQSLINRRSVVVVVSDGLDTGDPQMISQAMERLALRSGTIIWLNPLLGTPGYEPRSKGMLAALPHIDFMAPVRDVSTLQGLETILRKERLNTR